jgi:hypothetical protein
MAAAGILTTNWAVLEWMTDAVTLILLNHPKNKESDEPVTSLKISFEQRMDVLKRCAARVPLPDEALTKLDDLVSRLKTARHNRDTIVHGLSIKSQGAINPQTVLFNVTNMMRQKRKIDATVEVIHRFADDVYGLTIETGHYFSLAMADIGKSWPKIRS